MENHNAGGKLMTDRHPVQAVGAGVAEGWKGEPVSPHTGVSMDTGNIVRGKTIDVPASRPGS